MSRPPPQGGFGQVQIQPTDPIEIPSFAPKGDEVVHCLFDGITPGRVQTQKLKGRIVESLGLNNFVVIQFSKKTDSEDIKRVLKRGVRQRMDGRIFRFLGHSNSQLKSRSCFMFAGRESADQVLARFGDFDKISSISKRAKRIGLLFTSCKSMVRLPKVLHGTRLLKMEMLDINHNNKSFTDGCGDISRNVCEEIASKCGLKYVPSAFQIRCEGYKGVLMVNPKLPDRVIRFRPSMNKFSVPNAGPEEDLEIGIVDYSKPLRFGYLNAQIVILLTALGVQESTLLAMHREYVDCVHSMTSNVARAINYLIQSEKYALAKELVSHPSEQTLKSLQLMQRKELEKLRKEEKERIRIFVRKSRNVLGVCDPTRSLKYGQCFLRTVIDGTLTTITGKVLVTRNPCYYPGDLRVLEAVPGNQDLLDIQECIVFPVLGNRPHQDEMSGGDLDGDHFFVTWDPKLIPPSPLEEFPPLVVDVQSNTSTGNGTADRIDYFACFSNNVGKIDSTFMKYASDDKYGPSSEECKKLAILFSNSIDGIQDGSASELSELIHNAPNVVTNNNVWDVMLRYQQQESTQQNGLGKLQLGSMKMQLASKEIFEQAFVDPEINASDQSKKIRELWKKKIGVFPQGFQNFDNSFPTLKKIPRKQIEPSEASFGECTFDCKLDGCQKTHPPISVIIRKWQDETEIRLSRLAEKTIADMQILFQELANVVKPLDEKKDKFLKCRQEYEDACKRTMLRKVDFMVLETSIGVMLGSLESQKRELRMLLLPRIAHMVLSKIKIENKWTRRISILEQQLSEQKKEYQRLRCQREELQKQLQTLTSTAQEISIRGGEILQEIEQWDMTKINAHTKRIEENKRIFSQLNLVGDNVCKILSSHISSNDRVKLALRINRLLDHEYQQFQNNLPIYAHKETILNHWNERQVFVLTAETGSGKTTQVCQYIADAIMVQNWKSPDMKVCCTQPRRLAATSCCRKVAEEFGCEIGEEVGYHIGGGNKKISGKTEIEFVTEGLLLYKCRKDEQLRKYSVIILDEAHERHMETDVLLGMLLQLIQKRDDLKVIIMSASVDVNKFCTYFNCAELHVNVPRPFKVDIRYLDTQEDHVEQAVYVCKQIHSDMRNTGDVLVFLTGANEIERACKLMESCPDALIIPLYGSMDNVSNPAIYNSCPSGFRRKIVFATNIAETSITINGLAFVIDSGKSKQKAFESTTLVSSLKISNISKASAKQRSGRVGRTCKGTCIRLYTQEEFANFQEFNIPTIKRSDLSLLCLQLKKMGQDIRTFPFMDTPDRDNIENSIVLLQDLDMLNHQEELTANGSMAAEFEHHPQLTRALFTSITLGFSHTFATIAAMSLVTSRLLSPKSNLSVKVTTKENLDAIGESPSDHTNLYNMFEEWQKSPDQKKWCAERGMNSTTMKKALDHRKKIVQTMQKLDLHIVNKEVTMSLAEQVGRALCSGFFTNACRVYTCELAEFRSNHPLTRYFQVNCEQRRYLDRASGLYQNGYFRKAQWLVFQDCYETNKPYITNTAIIDPHWLEEYANKWCKRIGFPRSLNPIDSIDFEAGPQLISAFKKEFHRLFPLESFQLYLDTDERTMISISGKKEMVELLKTEVNNCCENVKNELLIQTEPLNNTDFLIASGGCLKRLMEGSKVLIHECNVEIDRKVNDLKNDESVGMIKFALNEQGTKAFLSFKDNLHAQEFIRKWHSVWKVSLDQSSYYKLQHQVDNYSLISLKMKIELEHGIKVELKNGGIKLIGASHLRMQALKAIHRSLGGLFYRVDLEIRRMLEEDGILSTLKSSFNSKIIVSDAGLTIYGPNQSQCLREIEGYVDQLDKKTINLGPGVLNMILKKREIQKLRERTGASIIVDRQEQRLHITGRSQAVKTTYEILRSQAVKDSHESLSSISEGILAEVEKCCLCKGMQEKCMHLGLCGHCYCKDCIQFHLFTERSKHNMPITCIKCGARILVADWKHLNLFECLKQQLNEVVLLESEWELID